MYFKTLNQSVLYNPTLQYTAQNYITMYKNAVHCLLFNILTLFYLHTHANKTASHRGVHCCHKCGAASAKHCFVHHCSITNLGRMPCNELNCIYLMVYNNALQYPWVQ